MSSVLRTTSANIELPNPNNVITPLYADVNEMNVPVPFSLTRNGVFDMDFSSGFDTTKSIETNETIFIRGSSFGALRTVNAIGPNIKAWFVARESADSASTVTLYKAPIVVRTNIVTPQLTPNDVDCYDAGLLDPPMFDFASGTTQNNYYSTYLFRTPMVIQYVHGGTTKYAVINTQFEGNT